MSIRKKSSLPTPATISKYVDQHAARVRKTQEHHQHGSSSLRVAEYAGHKIEVRTTYEVTIDGQPVTGHLGVTDDGNVHYHPVPNRSFVSAIDLVKALIDIFPDDFKSGGRKRPRRPADHPPHH